MSQKGEKIGEKTVTLRRKESADNSQNVYNHVKLSEFDVDYNDEILVQIYTLTSEDSWNDEWVGEVYKTQKRITLPKHIIEEGELLPGEKVKFKFYQTTAIQSGSDSGDLIDTCNAIVDRSNDDNIKSYLNSKKVCEYFSSADSNGIINLKNVDSGLSIDLHLNSVTVNASEGHYYFSFPSNIRATLNTSPGDEIEVRTQTDNANKDDVLKIDEIHSMVSEMYNAYLENKNA